MNHNINKQYKISFSNEISKFDGFPSEIDKSVETISDILCRFLYEWISVKEIDEELLPNLDEAIDDTQSETVGVYMLNGEARLYDLSDPSSSPLTPEFTLPINDFREIIKNWREFLLTPPLNGTKV